jgi:glycosyltransferase involved in cell wall biosynthesis
MKKVAIFIPSLERGGVERNVVYLAKGLIEHNFDVDLLTANASEVFLKQLPDSVRVVKLAIRVMPPRLGGIFSNRLRLALSILPALFSYFFNQHPEAVISFQSSVAAIWAKRLTRSKTHLIVRESNTASVATASNKDWFSKLVPYLKRCSYSKADAIVAVSKGVAEDLAQNIRIPRDRIHVIYNPTFDDSIVRKAAEPLEHEWFQPGQPPVILGVGRLTQQKDFATLLKAFSIVLKEIPARLLILGEGHKRDELKALAVELRIQDDVQFYGFEVNPYKYMVRANVFVLSSIYEGLPNALIEAQALGVPVVSTDCPSGPREILLNGMTGLLVPVGDFQALAREILWLLENKDRAMPFIEEGHKQIGRFRPDRTLKQYLKLLDESNRYNDLTCNVLQR